MCVGETLPQVHMNFKASTHTRYKISKHLYFFFVMATVQGSLGIIVMLELIIYTACGVSIFE